MTKDEAKARALALATKLGRGWKPRITLTGDGKVEQIMAISKTWVVEDWTWAGLGYSAEITHETVFGNVCARGSTPEEALLNLKGVILEIYYGDTGLYNQSLKRLGLWDRVR